METLRFITCGSVDDGKSTLIGRLLYETKNIFDDQMESLQADSHRFGTQGGRMDFALLLDGLQAEREQGITIDVAYRFFATDKRRFVVADAPGHEQYTRNMATGASTASLAIILIDARKGVLTQTRRHSRIVAMMGIRHVVLAVNKMDLLGFDEAVFNRIVEDYREFAATCGFASMQPIPLSAVDGDNVMCASVRTPWYGGPSLMAHLERITVSPDTKNEGFAMPVQWVNRPNLDFRGFCGRIAQGEVRPGDAVQVLPSGVQTIVRAVLLGQQSLAVARAGDSVTVTLDTELDASRGDMLAASDSRSTGHSQALQTADQFEARLIWMAEQVLVPSRQYLIKLHTKEATATITNIKYREDVNTGARLAANTLSLNEIASVNVSTSQPLTFEPYETNRVLGGFILIDKLSFDTVAAGMITFALRRASNLHWQALTVNQALRAAIKSQKPRCIWFTGLSGSGKSTLANLLEKRLHAEGKHTYILDGDNVRHGLNRDLGFTEVDRAENIRRVAEVARLMVDAGLIVLVAFISPYESDRRMARDLFGVDEFLEVFVNAPLQECEKRDPKGLYAKARRGELKNFTGIDSAYEPPATPDLRLDTVAADPHALIEQLMECVNR